MPRACQHPKDQSVSVRVDPKLKADFRQAAAEEDKTAAQVLCDFMHAYVERRGRHFASAAREQSRRIAARAADPTSDEAEIMHWIEDVAGGELWPG